jgi:predicted glutamine amidotransferase
MEYYGSARFGWGVAWLESGRVRRYRDPGSMQNDGAVGGELASVVSTEFVVHFRRPTLLSTIEIADTQPFLTQREDLAFCHNGLFTEAEAYRPELAGRLAGAADSEIGFCMLQDLVDAGTTVYDALAIAHSKLGGNANLATLDSQGAITLYSKHERNQFYTFRLGDTDIAATELHSPDESLFSLIFPGATNRAIVHESVIL